MIIIGVIMHHHSCGGRPLSPTTKRRHHHHHQRLRPLNHHYPWHSGRWKVITENNHHYLDHHQPPSRRLTHHQHATMDQHYYTPHHNHFDKSVQIVSCPFGTVALVANFTRKGVTQKNVFKKFCLLLQKLPKRSLTYFAQCLIGVGFGGVSCNSLNVYNTVV